MIRSGGNTMEHPRAMPAGATFDSHRFQNAAGSRRYKLYVPSVYRGDALPLIIMLHGCGQSPDDFASGTRMNMWAENQALVVGYPEQSRPANSSRCWNWFNERDQQREGGEPSLIAGITRRIMEQINVQPGRVYVAGFSAGGSAAAIMGVTYPDLFAAVGVHSGLACGAAREMSSAFAAMRLGGVASSGRAVVTRTTVPTIVFHGDGDTTVSPVNGREVIVQASPATGLQTMRFEERFAGESGYVRTIHIDRAKRSVLEHRELRGVGHAWAGGSRDASYTNPGGPDASREMIRFFLQHTTRA